MTREPPAWSDWPHTCLPSPSDGYGVYNTYVFNIRVCWHITLPFRRSDCQVLKLLAVASPGFAVPGGSCAQWLLCLLLVVLTYLECLVFVVSLGHSLSCLVSSCVLCRPLRFLILGFYSDQKFSFLVSQTTDTLKTTTKKKKKKTVSAFGGGLKQRLSHRRGFASCGVNTEAP